MFDILPLYGTLKPGETEQITLTFYGHANIGSEAKALCEVEGGPTYELDLKGRYRIWCFLHKPDFVVRHATFFSLNDKDAE